MTDRLTDAELDELEAVAKAATPGPWICLLSEHDDNVYFGPRGSIDWYAVGQIHPRNPHGAGEDEKRHNVAYVTAFDPPTAQALVREVRELRKTVEEGAFARKVYSAVLARDASALNAALTETYGAIRTHITQEDMAWADDVLKSRQYPLQSTQPVEGGWRPIETAPKDGTPIQARIPGHGSDNIIAWVHGFLDDNELDCSGWAFVEDQEPPADWTDGVCWARNEDGQPSTSPTHWQPLPPPPAQEEE